MRRTEAHRVHGDEGAPEHTHVDRVAAKPPDEKSKADLAACTVKNITYSPFFVRMLLGAIPQFCMLNGC